MLLGMTAFVINLNKLEPDPQDKRNYTVMVESAVCVARIYKSINLYGPILSVRMTVRYNLIISPEPAQN